MNTMGSVRPYRTVLGKLRPEALIMDTWNDNTREKILSTLFPPDNADKFVEITVIRIR